MKETCLPIQKGYITDDKGNKIKVITIPNYDRYYELNEIINQCFARKNELNGYVNIKFSLPHKPRSTGKKSQNHLINGIIQEIAEITGDDFDYVKTYCKKKAIAKGYPYRTSKLTGKAIPCSERGLDTIQAGYLIDAILEIVAFLGFTSKYDKELKESKNGFK